MASEVCIVTQKVIKTRKTFADQSLFFFFNFKNIQNDLLYDQCVSFASATDSRFSKIKTTEKRRGTKSKREGGELIGSRVRIGLAPGVDWPGVRTSRAEWHGVAGVGAHQGSLTLSLFLYAFDFCIDRRPRWRRQREFPSRRRTIQIIGPSHGKKEADPFASGLRHLIRPARSFPRLVRLIVRCVFFRFLILPLPCASHCARAARTSRCGFSSLCNLCRVTLSGNRIKRGSTCRGVSIFFYGKVSPLFCRTIFVNVAFI